MKAVIFDLDDTLLRDDRTISDYTVGVLRQASARGIHVIPASGRACRSMEPFVRQLDCASLFVACNGAEVWSPDVTLLDQVQMDVDIAREVARFAQERGCYIQTYAGPHFYYNMKGSWAEAYAASSMLDGIYVGDLERYLSGPTSKLLVMDEPDHVARYLTEARAQFDGRLSVSCSKPYFLEFNPLLATKGHALTLCAARLGFDVSEAVAFGDSLNDLSMLQCAGLGVAVANARDDVKCLCGDVCLSNQEDGVAHYIEQLLKEEPRP